MTASRAAAPRGARTLRYRVIAALLLAVAAFVVGRASVSPAERHRETDMRRTARAAPTERGAVRAAIGYLNALRWDVLVEDARRRRVIEARATPDAARQLDAELAAPAEALRGAVTRGPIVARSAVLGYRVARYEHQRASVRIWGMALFGTGVYEPTTQWSTSDIRLLWSTGRWLVDSVRSRGGPSPESPVSVLARRVRHLREVRHVP
jgi:hypothetical protein